MRICRVQIENFRNFKCLDVEVGDNIVLVGENKVGKSNFLHALRLVLDPTLPESSRRLRFEDFWDGAKPLSPDTQIKVSIDVADFGDNEKQFAVLSDYAIAHSPMVSRLNYAFFPRADLEEAPSKESDYDFATYGKDQPDLLLHSDVRRRLPMDLLPALRDAEADLASWRKSPLRPLLDALSGELDDDTKDSLAAAVSTAVEELAEVSEVKALGEQIGNALVELAGSTHCDSTTLSFSPTDADRLIRTLRIFVDDGIRSVSDASLGSTNLIYLALKLLALELEIKEKVRDHGFLAIEEPEAHLHPHVQRRVFRSFLRPRTHQADDDNSRADRTVLLTTHSPHIASVTPLESLVLLRSVDEPTQSTGHSLVNVGFDETEVCDMERYLDVTRGEILFARGVVLVEGDAEEYLVPVLAKLLGHDLDELGVSVCSVSGTNFLPYVKLLSGNGLGIPFAIITDEDPRPAKQCLAHRRVDKIVRLIDPEYEYSDDTTKLFHEATDDGVFVTEHTLEVAFFHCGLHEILTNAIEQLSIVKVVRERAQAWRADPGTIDEERMLKDIERIGKGRFAQRLSSLLLQSGEDQCPPSIKSAIEFVVDKL